MLYGSKIKKAEHITVSCREFELLWKKAGSSSIIDLAIENQKPRKVLIHDVAVDPLKDRPIHVDFYAVDVSKSVRVHIPFIFSGEAPAVKSEGGILLKLIHEVEIEALPQDLPHDIMVDVGVLKTFEDHITLKDITFPKGTKMIGEDDMVVALVEPPRKEEVEEAGPAEIDFEKIENTGKKGLKEKELSGEKTEAQTSESRSSDEK